MPGLEPTGLAVVPDDPWPAPVHNDVVDLSVLYRLAFIGEHGSAGDHPGILFAAAGGLARWNGSSWDLVQGFGLDAAAPITGTQTLPKVTLARAMVSAETWGIVGSDSSDRWLEEVTVGKTATFSQIRVQSGVTEFSFIVVGPHDPL